MGWTVSLRRPALLIAALAVFALAAQSVAFADGSEELGAPSIAIESGSGTVAAGTGLDDTGTGTINIVVPGTVKQALLYWEGQARGPNYDDTITVNGATVVGTVIGGPTLFIPAATYSTTVRADITAMVVSGANSFDISGVEGFDRHSNGAGLLVIYDDGSTADIGIFDGNDLAFIGYEPTLDTTVAKTFTFAAEPVDRVSKLTTFTSSVAESNIPGLRPSVIEVTLSDGTVIEYDNVLDGVDGNQWDTFVSDVTIPAGVTSLTVQVLSEDRLGTGNLPASLVWSGAALAVPTTPTSGGGEGCTPGYWKQTHHFDSWVSYAPGDSFATVFGVAYDKTLVEALGTGGGGAKALGRHAVAALLNASSSVDSSFTTGEVIALVQDAYASGDYESVKNVFEADNESGCPLN